MLKTLFLFRGYEQREHCLDTCCNRLGYVNDTEAGLFYAGMVKRRNAIVMIALSFTCLIVVSLQWESMATHVFAVATLAILTSAMAVSKK